MKRIGKYLCFSLYSVVLFSVGIFWMAKKAGSVMIEKQMNVEKFHKLFLVLDAWIKKKQQGKSMADFLKRNAYHSVAIYGLSNVGRLLEEDLKDLAEIRYGIDRREISAGFPVFRPEEDLPKVDAVIVTAAYEFDEIEEMLKKKLSCPIYSIEDIIYFMN